LLIGNKGAVELILGGGRRDLLLDRQGRIDVDDNIRLGKAGLRGGCDPFPEIVGPVVVQLLGLTRHDGVILGNPGVELRDPRLLLSLGLSELALAISAETLCKKRPQLEKRAKAKTAWRSRSNPNLGS